MKRVLTYWYLRAMTPEAFASLSDTEVIVRLMDRGLPHDDASSLVKRREHPAVGEQLRQALRENSAHKEVP